ncbi:cell cycle arrest in response to pheromone-related protein [Pseudohyphozyma bogoriensis]|nr:cell cycle arrest in response to pheromone-related protein [Pseudohyphozyma bogoriensis]
MVRDQDELARSLDKSSPRKSVWNNRGLSAMFQTCKDLSDLVAPLLFKDVTLAKVGHKNFDFEILPKYGHHIKCLDLVSSAARLSRTTDRLRAFASAARIPTINKLSLTTWSLDAFAPFLLHANRHNHDRSTERLFSLLATRIVDLTITCHPQDAHRLLSSFLHLTALDLTPGLYAKAAATIPDAIAQLKKLETLTLRGSTLWPWSTSDSAAPPPVKVLNICVSIRKWDEDLISHITAFADTLKELHLPYLELKDTDCLVAPIKLPTLQHIFVGGSPSVLLATLEALSGSPLTTIHYHQKSGISALNTSSLPLQKFSKTLKHLAITESRAGSLRQVPRTHLPNPAPPVNGTSVTGGNAAKMFGMAPTPTPTSGQAQKSTLAASHSIRKNARPGITSVPYTPPPVTPSVPAPPTTSNPSASSGPNPNSASSPTSVFPALHLTPLNDTFVPKQISLNPVGTKVKIGRQTNAKTVPNHQNGYFDSKVLSRMHAEVWADHGKVFIKDVKSSNGTFINGERLSAEGAESDIFELHSDDVVEFGIDIVSDDTKTIVHHKVAAKVYLVMNQEDALISSREFNTWYRNADSSALHRRGAKSGGSGSNGLSFDHVLSRLQGELQKSRDTGSHLGDLNSTLNEVHDHLGGGIPPPPNFNRGLNIPPYQPNASKDVHSQSIAALQSQLNETQNSLAGHVGKMRDLEGLLAEHETIKHEVGSLRKQMEDAQRDMESVMRGRSSKRDGRESPVAALLEEEEDEDDSRSVASTDTIRLNTKEQLASIAAAAAGMSNGASSVNGTSKDVDEEKAHHEAKAKEVEEKKSEDLAREQQLQEQNQKLSARLEALSVELDEATKLGQTLRSQHAEASSTIKALEARIAGLEKAVEGRVAEAEGKVMKEAETRWNGWREAFEESWKKERESWDEEREKLLNVVKEWEERKKSEIEEREYEGSSSDDEEEEAGAPEGSRGVDGAGAKGPKSKRTRSKRRRRSTASRVSALAGAGSGLTASDSDSTIGDASKSASGEPWNASTGGGPSSSGAGYDNRSSTGAAQPNSLPVVSAGSRVYTPEPAVAISHLSTLLSPLGCPLEDDLAVRVLTHKSCGHESKKGHSEKMSFIAELGATVGSEWKLEKAMRWREVRSPKGEFTGLFKSRGSSVEAIIGAVYMQHGIAASAALFNNQVLPHLALPQSPSAVVNEHSVADEPERELQRAAA